MSKTQNIKMDVLLETKKRLEDRIAYIKNVVWGPSPFIEMLELRRKALADIKGKTTEELNLFLCFFLTRFELFGISEQLFLSLTLPLDEQKNCNAYIEEMVQKEMQLRDINMEIWRENRNN